MQRDKYKKHFMKHMKETFWFGIFDLDEFLYARKKEEKKELDYLFHLKFYNFCSQKLN